MEHANAKLGFSQRCASMAKSKGKAKEKTKKKDKPDHYSGGSTSKMMDNTSSKLKEEQEVCVRHACNTQWVAKVNNNMSPAQISRIEATPFKWMLSFPEKLKISGKLLRELAWRWDKRSGGFRIQNRIARFTHIDVCFALGLSIIGDDVQFVENLESETQKLFVDKRITRETILDQLGKLRGPEDVDDFCRLYILLGLTQFYFPSTSTLLAATTPLHCDCIKLLDDLSTLGKYNWGVAVYNCLVDSLTKTNDYLLSNTDNTNNKTQMTITGCAIVLQVWAYELILGSDFKDVFPRFLNWNCVYIHEEDVFRAFENNQIRDKVQYEEDYLLVYEVMKEALTYAPEGYVHWKKLKPLLEQLKALEEKAKALEAKKRERALNERNSVATNHTAASEETVGMRRGKRVRVANQKWKCFV